jgi:hypothetical protein
MLQRNLSFVFSGYLALYCIVLSLTCGTRILAGGVPESSGVMFLYAASASIVLVMYACMLWRTKVLNFQTIALALSALLPELWVWFGEISLRKAAMPFWIYLDLFLLLALVVLVSFCVKEEVTERFWLCLFFCKGMVFFLLVGNIYYPFFHGAIESMAGKIVSVILVPVFWLFFKIYTVGQLLALGYIWLWKEKKLKQPAAGE